MSLTPQQIRDAAMSFQAKYPGQCAACGERIHEGQWVRYEDDFLVHTECLERESSKWAKQICQVCPVRLECLREALDNPDWHGVWGGTTKTERLDLRKGKVA